MDVNEQRAIHIALNNLQNTDDVYTFYYDETNNHRKLHLTGTGLNVEQDDNFVLAGILHKGLQHNVEYSALYDELNLQKTIKEMKLKHIAKGSFLDMLKSKKLCAILVWLNENNFYIHYFNLNLVYWSILDIVDSIMSEADNPFYLMYHMQIKSDFYELANSSRGVFLKNLQDFNYPDVQKEKCNEFYCWLVAFVKNNSAVIPDFNANILNTLMKDALKADDFPFISGFDGGQLISSFMIFYLRNLYLFKNAKHIFDDEYHIENDIKEVPLTENGKPIDNYEFVKSHEFEAIQISDVIAGFLGKYFTYLKNVSDEKLKLDRNELDFQQIETLAALRQLIDASDDVSQGFFNVVSSEGEQRRNVWFLHT